MTGQQSIPDDPVYSRKVLEMLTVANEYCLFLEKAEDYTKQELYQFLQKIVPLIYLKASLLPVVDAEDEEATEHYVTEEQWETMFNVLRNKFEAEDQFHFIDLHERSHTDALTGSMAENFTDIYQDLKDFVLLYQNPLKSFKENAVQDCRHLFENRFGFRLVTVHAALHYLLFTGEKDEGNF
ncbi:MAG: DUF5063 domain-containing protein [Bacteroidales bacterium]|jgi:hypothetical protein|nr:DUF5063 domain-containing protein [Bacteroidales bacterium]